MQVRMIFILLFFLSSCDMEINPAENETKSESKSLKLLDSCYDGCNYNISLFKGLKLINKESISLNNKQLNFFGDSCLKYCDSIYTETKESPKEEAPFEIKSEELKKNTIDKIKNELVPFEEI